MKRSPLSRACWSRSGIATVLLLLGLVKASDDVTSASGVNIHFTDPQAGELEMMKAAGFKWARMDFFWGAMEKERGVYDFSAYDRLVAALTNQGIHAYFILDYANPLYEPLGSVRSEAGRAAYTKWALAAVEHFKGRGIIWEFWNEPNGGFWPPAANAGEYVAMALEASQALRQVFPQERLVGPATSTIDMAFLEACGKAGLLKYWDGLSVHPYRQSGPETVEEDYEAVRSLIEKYGPPGRKIPILSGEWGYSSAWAGYDADLQGRMLPRQWLINAASGVPVSIWYDWRDDGPDPKEPEHRFGTVMAEHHADRDPVFDPKPAYLAAQTYNQVLAECRLVRRLSLGRAERQGMLFEHGDKLVLAAWTTEAGEQAVKLPSDDGEFPVVSHLGGDLGKLAAKEGRISFAIDGAPRYVIFEHGNRGLAAAPEALEVRLTLLPAGDGQMAVELENRSQRAFRGRLELAGSSKDVAVAAGGRAMRVAFPVKCAADGSYRAGVKLEVEGAVAAELAPRTFFATDEAALVGSHVAGEGNPEVGGTFSILKKEAPEELPVGGRGVMRLDYEFQNGWKFASVSPGPEARTIEAGNSPVAFGAWIFGDGSGTSPRLRLQDAGGRVWQPSFPAIAWKGWKYVEAKLDPDTAHWGGGDEKVRRAPELPLKWVNPLLLDNPQQKALKGLVYFTMPAVIRE